MVTRSTSILNALKKKGSAFESATRDYLRWALADPRIDRAALHGTGDVGDITGVSVYGAPVVIECKFRKQLQAYEALREAEREERNATSPDACKGSLERLDFPHAIPAAIVHLPGHGLTRSGMAGQLVVLPYGVWGSLRVENQKHPAKAQAQSSYGRLEREGSTEIRIERFQNYRQVDRLINSLNPQGVRAWPAYLPGKQVEVVDVTNLRMFATALNHNQPLGGEKEKELTRQSHDTRKAQRMSQR